MNAFVIIAPVFAILILGYGLGRTNLFPENGDKALITFVWYIAIPALLFRAMATNPTPNSAELILIAGYYSAVFTVYFISTLIMGYVFKGPMDERASFAFSCCFANGMFIGLPIIESMYGHQGVRLLLILLSVHSFSLITTSTLIVETSRQGAGALHKVAGTTMFSLVKNPIIIALAVGISWAGLALPFPEFLDRMTSFPAAAAAPCGLFAAGMSLSKVKIAGDVKQAITGSLIKIIVLPMAVYGSTKYLYGLPDVWVGVATMLAAMPSGIIAYSFAVEYNAAPRRSASIVILSTSFAALSLSALINILH
jgi:malonate transporter and related proteins